MHKNDFVVVYSECVREKHCALIFIHRVCVLYGLIWKCVLQRTNTYTFLCIILTRRKMLIITLISRILTFLSLMSDFSWFSRILYVCFFTEEWMSFFFCKKKSFCKNIQRKKIILLFCHTNIKKLIWTEDLIFFFCSMYFLLQPAIITGLIWVFFKVICYAEC